MFGSDALLFQRGKRPKPTNIIAVSQPNIMDFRSTYHSSPSEVLEMGGIMCGKRHGDVGEIHRLVWIPSLMPANDTYTFDSRVVRFPEIHCGNEDFVGMFHTHPSHATQPSTQDMKVSDELNVPGCVLTDRIRCYRGYRELPVQIFNGSV